MAHARQKIRFCKVGFFRSRLGADQLDVVGLQNLVELFALRDITRCGEHTLQRPSTVIKRRSVVGHHRLFAIQGARREFVIGNLVFSQYLVDGRLGPVGIREIALKGGAYQFIPRATRECFHLLVRIGNDAKRIGGHQCVDVGFNQRARIELLVAQTLVKLLSLFPNQFAGGIVGADEQVADDGVVVVAQRGDRHDHRKTAAVLADIRQLVNVLDTA